jgi:hypothetical protein
MTASHSEEALYYEGAPLSLSLLMRRAHLSTTSNVIDDCNMPALILTHFAPHFISNFNGSPTLAYLLTLAHSATPAFTYISLAYQQKARVELHGTVSFS